MKRLIVISVVLGLLVSGLWLVGVASAQDPLEVAVTLKDFTIGMATTTIPANTPVKFVVTNQGAIAHEVVLEKAGIADEPLEIRCGGGDCVADVAEIEPEHLPPGATATAVWTISEAGQYQLACHVPSHYEAGMVVTFTVAAAAAAPAVTPATAEVIAPLPVSEGILSPPVRWILTGLGILLVATILVAVLVLSRRPA